MLKQIGLLALILLGVAGLSFYLGFIAGERDPALIDGTAEDPDAVVVLDSAGKPTRVAFYRSTNVTPNRNTSTTAKRSVLPKATTVSSRKIDSPRVYSPADAPRLSDETWTAAFSETTGPTRRVAGPVVGSTPSRSMSSDEAIQLRGKYYREYVTSLFDLDGNGRANDTERQLASAFLQRERTATENYLLERYAVDTNRRTSSTEMDSLRKDIEFADRIYLQEILIAFDTDGNRFIEEHEEPAYRADLMRRFKAGENWIVFYRRLLDLVAERRKSESTRSLSL